MRSQLRRVRNYFRRPAAPQVAVPASQPSLALDSAWDTYLSWLSFVNAGMLARGNADAFAFAIGHLPSAAPIIEIGSFCGLSTNAITHFKEKLGVKNRLITCGKWIFEGAQVEPLLGGSPHLTHSEYREFVRSTYIRNIQTFARFDLPYTVEMFSDEFFAAWSQNQHATDVLGRELQLGGPISFCYIDGNHSYAFAQRDFQNVDLCLEAGGFILFDNSADGSEWEVCRVVAEVKSGGRYDLVAHNPNYLFRKK